MVTLTEDSRWLVGDAVPEPAEGIYWAGERVLMPVAEVCRQAMISLSLRSKLLRAAVISTARSRWGPSAGTPWQPTDAAFDPERPAVERLCGHRFWERLTALGAGLHLAIPGQDVAATVDLVAQFQDGGLGVMAVWPGGPEVAQQVAPWIELGAAVAALADAQLPVARAIVICATGEGLKLESRTGDEALGEWVTALDLQRTMLRHGLAR
jgi:hypothetical protein